MHICYGYGIEANVKWKETLGAEWRQYEAIFPAINGSSIRQVSLECANSRVPISLIELLPDKELLVGAIDVASNTVETAEEVAATIAEAGRHADASRIFPCTNCGMAPLSRDVASGKLRALGAGAALARGPGKRRVLNGLPQIYVDADACPVKEEAVKVAERHGLTVTFVSNGALRPSRDPAIRNVVVPRSADAADDWIVGEARPNDIVITADIPLAARAVALGAHVLGMSGKPFTPETIGMALAMRDLNRHLRESGQSKGYNAQFSQRDRSAFLGALDRAVRRALKIAAG